MHSLSLSSTLQGSGRASCDLAALLEVVRLVEEDGLELEDVPQHLGEQEEHLCKTLVGPGRPRSQRNARTVCFIALLGSVKETSASAFAHI